jgi:hypothetical protein
MQKRKMNPGHHHYSKAVFQGMKFAIVFGVVGN